MIDEKKLIEVIKSVQNTMVEMNKKVVLVDAMKMFPLFVELVESQPKVGEWIPISENPNGEGTYIVAWLPAFKDEKGKKLPFLVRIHIFIHLVIIMMTNGMLKFQVLIMNIFYLHGCHYLHHTMQSEVGRMINRPYMNDYCEKCKHHYLLDGDESRCRRIKEGMSNMMCVQVVECPCFTLKEGKKVE